MLGWWKKYWSDKPAWEVETDPATGKRSVVDWNEKMVQVAHAAGGVATYVHWKDAKELVNEHLEWLENKDNDRPWILHGHSGQPLRWNKAAADAAAAEFKVEVPADKVKQQELMVRHETRAGGLSGDMPFMQANHYGFDQDGGVKLELDWNRSFINHLRDYGFEGDEDLDVIKSYMAALTSKPPAEQLIESFDQLRDWAGRTGEGEEVIKALDEKIKETKRARRKR